MSDNSINFATTFQLFQNDHSAGGLIYTGTERVEIDATGNGVSHLVFAVPIRRAFSVEIAAFRLHPEIQLAHKLSPDIVDINSDWSVGG